MSSVVIIRHAIAEERVHGLDDGMRALTEKGHHRMRQVSRGLTGLIEEISLIATSPLVRAVETAEILAEHFAHPLMVKTNKLSPGASLHRFTDWLAEQQSPGTIACIGHEPDLGMLAGLLLCNRDGGPLSFKKSGACCIDFQGSVHPGTGTLRWHIPPKVLRQLEP